MTPSALQIIALMQGALNQQTQATNLLLQELAAALEKMEPAKSDKK